MRMSIAVFCLVTSRSLLGVGAYSEFMYGWRPEHRRPQQILSLFCGILGCLEKCVDTVTSNKTGN